VRTVNTDHTEDSSGNPTEHFRDKWNEVVLRMIQTCMQNACGSSTAAPRAPSEE